MSESEKQAPVAKKSFKERLHLFFHPEGARLEMLRYRPNGVSYGLTFLGCAAMAASFCLIYSGTVISKSKTFSLFGITSLGFWAAFDVLLNIVLLLFLFLAASQMKTYSRKWGIFALCVAVFECIRPFLYPLALRQADILNSGLFVAVVILQIGSGVCFLIAGLVSIYRGQTLQAYLKTVKPIENEKIEAGK
jgi:hypothetical protein